MVIFEIGITILAAVTAVLGTIYLKENDKNQKRNLALNILLQNKKFINCINRYNKKIQDMTNNINIMTVAIVGYYIVFTFVCLALNKDIFSVNFPVILESSIVSIITPFIVVYITA